MFDLLHYCTSCLLDTLDTSLLFLCTFVVLYTGTYSNLRSHRASWKGQNLWWQSNMGETPISEAHAAQVASLFFSPARILPLSLIAHVTLANAHIQTQRSDQRNTNMMKDETAQSAGHPQGHFYVLLTKRQNKLTHTYPPCNCSRSSRAKSILQLSTIFHCSHQVESSLENP